MEAFYKTQQSVARQHQQQQDDDIAAQWKAAVEASAKNGVAVEHVKCKVDALPTRACLDRLSTRKVYLVVDAHARKETTHHYGVPQTVENIEFKVRPARTGGWGILGWWDRCTDYSKASYKS
jgi:hypothetical protein